MSDEIQKFWDWRQTKIKENPTWGMEELSFFVDLYMQTYPGRRFQLVLQLMTRVQQLQRHRKLHERS